MTWWRWEGEDLVLLLSIQPRARRDEVTGLHDGRLRLRITAPPVEGKANRHLLGWLADAFGVPRSRVELESGESGRRKRARIHAPGRLPEWFGRLGGEG
ncbi:MAG: YggU family protein [Gammaproteobacteria bacterium]|nr:MAG: YggU family protein [Gammaproteobacteria bacterium]